MHIVIDGYNCIFRMGQLQQKDLQRAREEFILHVQSYIARKKVNITIIFDSKEEQHLQLSNILPSISSINGLQIVFCPDADDHIRNIVRDDHNPASIVVVSSDGSITRDVRKKGAKVKSPSEFDMLLNKSVCREKAPVDDNEKPSPESISEGEITDWLRKFSEKKKRNAA